MRFSRESNSEVIDWRLSYNAWESSNLSPQILVKKALFFSSRPTIDYFIELDFDSEERKLSTMRENIAVFSPYLLDELARDIDCLICWLMRESSVLENSEVPFTLSISLSCESASTGYSNSFSVCR